TKNALHIKELATKQTQKEAVLKRLDDDIANKEKMLEVIDNKKAVLQSEVELLEGKIEQSKTEISGLEANKTSLQQKISSLEADDDGRQVDAKKTLDETTQAMAETEENLKAGLLAFQKAEDSRNKAESDHQEFTEYEQRAKKALAAKEESLLAREKEVAEKE